jgi:hypothetical protein
MLNKVAHVKKDERVQFFVGLFKHPNKLAPRSVKRRKTIEVDQEEQILFAPKIVVQPR